MERNDHFYYQVTLNRLMLKTQFRIEWRFIKNQLWLKSIKRFFFFRDYYYLIVDEILFSSQTNARNATEEGRASTSWTMVESKTHCKGRRVWWRSCYYVSRWFVSFRYGYCWRNINALSTRYTGQYEQIIAFANESGLLNVNKIHSTIRFFLLDTCHSLKKKKFPRSFNK